ncbi:hypothetical protein [Bacillus thermotolerans]|uniref:Uncharacterized protein n=1 Tax=Bacillus thermotolerans TaxID=1221996 RepID=A0A0F5HZ21_BACTR|nr:hypothetical protein [Bacillus thermotolerans]KKB38310.1 hypothetical protein QY97_02843 [Bacillus thermotolerans]KKB39857.1 hypothetical protein QY95_02074 [Bacillus thermotolerans]KKB44294.1 hypothetical protein QY96_03316 [Bacillus thermotolerans]
MSKKWYWFYWGIAFMAVNLAAVPIAVFFLYGIEEGEGLLSADYAMATGTFLVSNFITLYTLLIIRSRDQRHFWIGWNIAALQVIALITFITSLSKVAAILTILLFSIALVLLIKQIRQNRWT